MEKDNILNILKQTFQQSLPKQDKRTTLSHLEFVTGLVFCFIGDTKSASLEAMRRFMMATFDLSISKGAFWERLSRNRLKKILNQTLADLIKKIPSVTVIGKEILDKLNVTSILLIDSSTLTLWDGAKTSYPGTRMTAGIKWHACFDLLSGKMEWFETSAASTHDRKCFPVIRSLKGKLIIFDLGYWDFHLFHAIVLAEGFFLSRVKTNAVITITEVVLGLNKSLVNEKLSSEKLKKRRGKIIEFIGKVGGHRDAKSYRVIGFWNTTEKKYHWYVTNLTVSSSVIYALYCIRWQIELIFKGSKRSFNLDDRVTSNNDNIIESLVLSSIIASFAMHVVLKIGVNHLRREELLSVSFQRLSHIVVLLAQDFIRFLTTENYFEQLKNKIILFSREIIEKNHRKRPTSLQCLAEALGCE